MRDSHIAFAEDRRVARLRRTMWLLLAVGSTALIGGLLKATWTVGDDSARWGFTGFLVFLPFIIGAAVIGLMLPVEKD